MPGSFFDTNVLVCLASSDTGKAARADGVLAGGGTISVQVLNELANVACRTMRLTWAETRAFLSAVTALVTVLPLTEQTHRTGLALAERYSLSVYSALIAACALNAGCDTLQSEDMQHGILIEGRLPVVNPFRAAL